MCFSIQLDYKIDELAKHLGAYLDAAGYKFLSKNIENEAKLSDEEFAKIFGRKKIKNYFKTIGDDRRLYPNVFGHVLIKAPDDLRYFTPMRFQVRPEGSKQEPRLNLYNSRLETLNEKATWSKLLGRNHGLVFFNSFYEYVPFASKSKLVRFVPKSAKLLAAPCLFDHWHSKDGSFFFRSFSIITKPPYTSVLEMGHDRSPLIIDPGEFDLWLSGDHDILKEARTDIEFSGQFDITA